MFGIVQQYVRYLSTGFEYFLSRFAGSLAPMAPTMVPSRARRALSVPYFAFFLSPPLGGEKAKNYEKIMKNHEIISITVPVSFDN